MPLSLSKLGSLLYDKDFIPKTFFRMEGMCIFIEIVSLTSGVTSMIYIPSRFNIPLSAGDNVVEIELIEPDSDPKAYDQDPVNSPEDKYSALDLKAGANVSAEDHLSQKYKKVIELKSGEKRNINVLKDIIRQLTRLQYCVDDLPYHLIIYQDSYICFMRDGDSDCYIRSQFKGNLPRCLRIAATLGLFYDKGFNMDNEVKQISSGIQKILDKNMSSHATYLEDLVKKKGDLLRFANLLGRKKQQYQDLLEKYEKLLAMLDVEEKNLKKAKENLSLSDGTIDGDLQKSQTKADLDRKIRHCLIVKQRLIDNMTGLQTLTENLSLSADKILYDNSVMMDKIFNNFEILIDICK